MQRMGVAHQSQAPRPALGLVDGDFQGTGRAGQLAPLGAGVHRPTSAGRTRRCTTWPFFRWDSTISSMSAWSTKLYQVPSG